MQNPVLGTQSDVFATARTKKLLLLEETEVFRNRGSFEQSQKPYQNRRGFARSGFVNG